MPLLQIFYGASSSKSRNTPLTITKGVLGDNQWWWGLLQKVDGQQYELKKDITNW